MLVAIIACVLAAAAWVYLVAGHGGFWLTRQRLPAAAGGVAGRGCAARWPAVTAVIPARNEAATLQSTLPTLLAQDYPGTLEVVLVDDGSVDGTAGVAASLGAHADRSLTVVAAGPPPAGWTGKVWAMARGLAAAGIRAGEGGDAAHPGSARYILFTDADIGYSPGSVTALVRAALGDDRCLVSQMALLRAESFWECAVVPAFVYFFAQLYPFRRVNHPGSRTAAAAGGCMLVRREVLAAVGGLEPIRGALIDDVALGRLVKTSPGGSRCWLGLTRDVVSVREYPRLADLWRMVARSAYTQLRYSPALLAGTVTGLLWIYLAPPAAAAAGVALLATGDWPAAAWLAGAGLAGWAMMSVSYLPVLRLYRLSPLRCLSLPLVALVYAAMTVDSARLHYAGRGGQWKGRAGTGRRGRA